MRYETASNEEIGKGLSEIYNSWFCKWRDRKLTEADWDIAIKELSEIINKTKSTLVSSTARAMLTELEERNKDK